LELCQLPGLAVTPHHEALEARRLLLAMLERGVVDVRADDPERRALVADLRTKLVEDLAARSETNQRPLPEIVDRDRSVQRDAHVGRPGQLARTAALPAQRPQIPAVGIEDDDVVARRVQDVDPTFGVHA